MSTQDPNAGVPITVRRESDLQHVRLLELPAELLALVTGDSPPRLHLKSKDDIDGTSKDAIVVLCSEDKTYNIRQVSTSNSVYLTTPYEATLDSGGGPPRIGVQAVAKCDTTIELLSTPRQSAAPYIKVTLPTLASTGNYGSGKSISKAELFAHIPLSTAECEEGWLELACFESKDRPGCYIPSGKVKAAIWEAIMTACVADGADLTAPFLKGDYPPFAMDVCQDWPTEVVTAVFASVSKESPGGNLAVDEERTVRFVGTSLLQAKSEGKAIDVTEFSKAWRDLVLEAWRSKCELTALQGSYALQDGGSMINFVDNIAAGSGVVNASTESKSLGAKRKWHEKFGASRKKA